MDANELMIGDWVVRESHKNTPQQVIGIGDKGVTLKLEGGWCGEAIDLIEPIPLTPEILEKNGFVKVPHEYEYPDCQCWTNDVDGIYSFEIVADEYRRPYILGNGDMGDYEWVNFECKYVHELQHALRLAGIKKEIVL